MRALAVGLARAAGAVVLVVLLAWLLVEAAPGEPGEKVARAAGVLPADDGAVPAAARQELLDRLAARHGMDGGLLARMAGRLGDLARLDLGRSWRTGQPARAEAASALGPTAVHAGGALLLSVLLGLALAIASAWRAGRRLDRALGALAALVLAVPVAWLGILLLDAAGGQPSSRLAILALAAAPAFALARHGRAALLEATAEPWAIAARARGVSAARLVAVHALRRAAAELAPLLPVLVGALLGASLVVERLFGIHGLGAQLAAAAASGDAPVLVACAAAAALLVALASLAGDLLARWADPRRRA